MRFPRKFPTLIGIILFILFVGGFAFAFERIVRLPGQASASIVPKLVEVTNVSDATFTLSWITELPATGAITVSSKKSKSQVFYDERDGTGKLKTFTTHTVTVRSAKPNTVYAIKILSNGKTFLDSGKPYEVQTASVISGSTNGEPAYGSVVESSGQPASGALVYLTITNGQTLSTVVAESGSWIIPLNLLRTADLTQFLSHEDRMNEQIVVRLGSEESFTTTDTLNDSPVPEMQLGKTYDFRRQQAQIPRPPDVLGATTITLVKPQEGSSLATTVPLIQGTGIPGNLVSITLSITNPVGGTATVGGDGLWRYTPPAPLAPGKQSVTITTVDENKKPIAITHMFEILKSGTQVLGSATPSATPALSPTPASTLAGEPLPQSGSTLPTIILLLLGIGLVASGLLTLSPRFL